MSKFKVGDKVREVQIRDFVAGTVLKVVRIGMAYPRVVIAEGEIKVGDWVEFTEDYSNKCKIGTKVQVTKIVHASGEPVIRYQVPGGTEMGSSFVSRVKKCEAPDPWEGIEWARGIASHEYRSVNYLNTNYGRYTPHLWKPVKLEDMTKEDLIGLINHNKSLMDGSK